MATAVASVVFFSSDPHGLARVLRAVDVDLEHEVHDDEVEHWACELGDVHVAVYPGETSGAAPGLREGGSTFVGVYVDDLDRCARQVEDAGLAVLEPHARRPWGCRFIVASPDGRAIEVNQRDHCATGSHGPNGDLEHT